MLQGAQADRSPRPVRHDFSGVFSETSAWRQTKVLMPSSRRVTKTLSVSSSSNEAG